ncbi:nuclear transport factor 2 family protein [Nocardia sp. XZ_19_385]|uniref:nuclear transport factor 2 family protein n=1 Tax=Nocardia sp. XZ_19_385 TaxID=2769488 RepID=UPI00188EAB1D|nr:nuclear transport factor 2 family protein [Nocardia sp. XZ_19_385]
MSQATQDLFERYHACWADRDPDRIAEMHSPDSIFHLHSGGKPARGRDEIRASAADTFAMVPDLTFNLVNLRVGDDFWTVQWTLSGTSAVGNVVDVDIMDLVLVANGEVLEKHTYVDGVAMQAALTPSASA